VEDLAQTFQRAGVPCRLSDNLEGDLWQKLIVNCAGNAVCALGRVGYGPAARNPFARRIIADAEEEARCVARAAGVRLPQSAKNLLEILEKYDPEVTSSTAQDIAHSRRTEIDSLNGYVLRRGEELGVATPVNRTLHALVKLLEESF
jgi:2-dehydropantoate 2-reductase